MLVQACDPKTRGLSPRGLYVGWRPLFLLPVAVNQWTATVYILPHGYVESTESISTPLSSPSTAFDPVRFLFRGFPLTAPSPIMQYNETRMRSRTGNPWDQRKCMAGWIRRTHYTVASSAAMRRNSLLACVHRLHR